MADAVKLTIEETLPEIHDYERRGLFSSLECKKIVKSRTDHEYRLRGRSATIHDFMKAIEYEKKLDALREKRRHSRHVTKSSMISDFACKKRIHSLYHRVIRKHRERLPLWMEYIDYCISTGSNKTLSRMFAQALQFHPNNASLWAYAGVWEYESNAEVKAARTMFQRGLRYSPDSDLLWKEFIRMELSYVQRLKKRRELLLDAGKKKEEEIDFEVPEGSFETGDDVIDLRERQEKPTEVELETQSVIGEGLNIILSGAVARVAIQHGLRARSKDVDFAQSLLTLIREFDGPETLSQLIYDHVETLADTDPKAVRLLAERQFMEAETLNEKVEAAETALERYVTLAKTLKHKGTEEDNTWKELSPMLRGFMYDILSSESNSDEEKENAIGALLKAWDNTIDSLKALGPLPIALAVEHAQCLILRGKRSEAMEQLESLRSTSWAVQQLLIRLATHQDGFSDSSIRRTASQVAEAAKTSKGEEERTRLAMAATALSALVSSQDDVEDDKAASHSSKKRKRSAPSEDDSESDGESESKQQKRRVRFDAALVEHAMKARSMDTVLAIKASALEGLEAARATFEKLRSRRTITPGGYNAMVALELSLEEDEIERCKRVRQLLTRATEDHGRQDISVWLDLHAFEESPLSKAYRRGARTPEQIIDNAKATCHDPSAFLEAVRTKAVA